jgi:hypothetical protein
MANNSQHCDVNECIEIIFCNSSQSPWLGIEPFNISVLLRVSWLNVFKPDPHLFRPRLYCRTDVFRPVVTANYFGLTSPRNDLLELPNHTL